MGVAEEMNSDTIDIKRMSSNSNKEHQSMDDDDDDDIDLCKF